MDKWYDRSGENGDIVISTRIRLARNLNNFPFPDTASDKERNEIVKRVRASIVGSNSYIAKDFDFFMLSDISRERAVSLAEKHLVSPEFISDPAGRALIINKSEDISIMINEEDHIRIQVMSPGLSLDQAFETADRIDTLLSENLSIAFNSKLGYLTQCPSNLGTGMRASVMLHLPGLKAAGAMQRIKTNLDALGITIRGTYGENSDVTGALYQLSNQISLGISEHNAVTNLTSIAKQIVAEEKKARNTYLKQPEAIDKISRSAGILKSARLLSISEYMELISMIRLGISCNIFQGISTEELNRLTEAVQPATLVTERECKPDKTDELRAEIVRKSMEKLI